MKKITLFSVVFAAAICMQAQEATVSAGGDATGTGGSSSYSVGQVVYTTNTGANGSMAQGVQQPYEISATTGIDVKEINLDFTVYPNPTVNNLKLSVGKLVSNNLSYQLLDNTGKLLQQEQITSNITTLNMEDLPKAIYFVRVMNAQALVKTFKIIKH
jgi:hypothetical protein